MTLGKSHWKKKGRSHDGWEFGVVRVKVGDNKTVIEEEKGKG